MAPEQARGDFSLTQRADIYSLGVVAFACLTGRLPFEAPSLLTTLRKVIDDPPIPPEELAPAMSKGVAYALRKVLSKDPLARYATAEAFVEAVQQGVGWVPTEREWATMVRRATRGAVAEPVPALSAGGEHSSTGIGRATDSYYELTPERRRSRAGCVTLVLFLMLLALAGGGGRYAGLTVCVLKHPPTCWRSMTPNMMRLWVGPSIISRRP